MLSIRGTGTISCCIEATQVRGIWKPSAHGKEYTAVCVKIASVCLQLYGKMELEARLVHFFGQAPLPEGL